MALTEILLRIDPVEIGLVTLDASVKEIHQASGTVTRHPVEASTGQTDISDHFHPDPLTVQIEGVVTNHPAEWIGTFDDSETRDVQAHLELLSTLLAGELITIRTTLYTYENMVLERFNVNRDANKGNALYLDATAVQVSLVDLEETELAQRPVVESTKGKGKKATQAADATTQAQSQSALSKFFF